MKNNQEIFSALTIAGSDSGGGAGIQADILTFASLGVFATSAIAAITAQNPDGVSAISTIPLASFKAQLEAVFEYFSPTAVKTGMLFDAEHILATADFMSKYPDVKLVVDPVMISTSGTRLLKDDAEQAMKENLLPLATLITPNLDEAEALLEENITDMQLAAKKLSEKFSTSVLLKGGHLDSEEIIDVLYLTNSTMRIFKSSRIPNIDTHGSGCTLSAAITANFAKGFSIEQSCEYARTFLIKGMKNPLCIRSKQFINHFPK